MFLGRLSGTIVQRLAVLEDICRRKDSAIQELKEEIIALEDQVLSVLLAHCCFFPRSFSNYLEMI
jgi:hypothetical protein